MTIKGLNSRWIFLTINLVIVNFAILAFLGKDFPMLGHDYKLAIPQMLDTALHFRLNGLSIQWYTPTFGGGLPAYPNPNNSEYSLLSLLTLWFNPWLAVIFSTIFFVSVGFLASYRFFWRVLCFNWTSSLLGAVFFLANGYMMERIAVGHLGSQLFPLLAVFLLVYFDSFIPIPIAILFFALLVSLFIHEAGYFLIIAFGLSFLIIFPLVFLVRRDVLVWKRITAITLSGGLVAALICASKFSAVYSFMRYFPRTVVDQVQPNLFLAGMGIFFQLLGTMNLVPISWITGHNPNLLPNNMAGLTGTGYGYWEYDMSMSPIVFGLLLAGVNLLLYRRKHYKYIFLMKKRWIGWLAFWGAVWLCVEFIVAQGLFYPLLRHLPILGSLHVNNRFTVAFLFPLAFIAAYIYNRWAVTWSNQKTIRLLIAANLFALVPLITYFTFSQDLQQRTYDITPSFHIYQSILKNDEFQITQIGYSGRENNTQVFLDHTSNLELYEPIFGYGLEAFHPEIKPGSVWGIMDGYYNMTNPSGYVFPDENASHPFERIRINETKKMEDFINHRQPDWKLSLYQQVANWVSAISFFLTLSTLCYFVFSALRQNQPSLQAHYKKPRGYHGIS